MMLELVQEEYSVRVVQQCCSQKIDKLSLSLTSAQQTQGRGMTSIMHSRTNTSINPCCHDSGIKDLVLRAVLRVPEDSRKTRTEKKDSRVEGVAFFSVLATVFSRRTCGNACSWSAV